VDTGKRAPHPVRIDDWQPAHRGVSDRKRRVDSTALRRDDGVGTASEVSFELGAGQVNILERQKLLDEYRRGAHAGHTEDIRRVGERLQRDHARGPVEFDGVRAEESADVGISPTAGSQKSRAAGEILEHLELDLHVRTPPESVAAGTPRSRSPLTLTRRRTAWPGT
jgi:hypothetical protein